jgi:hypothetical protein
MVKRVYMVAEIEKNEDNEEDVEDIRNSTHLADLLSL